MPAPGGATPVVGNNPVAIGVPHGEGEPIILDMALSEAALGKIRLAASEGQSIPDTWATDADGRPTYDPEEAIAGCCFPPLVQRASVWRSWSTSSPESSRAAGLAPTVRGLYADTSVPNDCAHAFIAIHPPTFGDGKQFCGSVADLAEQVVNSKAAPGVERVFLPGQIECDRHAAARQRGVPVSAALWRALEKTALDVGVALPEPRAGSAMRAVFDAAGEVLIVTGGAAGNRGCGGGSLRRARRDGRDPRRRRRSRVRGSTRHQHAARRCQRPC